MFVFERAGVLSELWEVEEEGCDTVLVIAVKPG